MLVSSGQQIKSSSGLVGCKGPRKWPWALASPLPIPSHTGNCRGPTCGGFASKGRSRGGGNITTSYLAKWDVPLQLERELLPLAGRLVLGADQHIVEQEEVPQLPRALGQLHSEGVLDEVPLRTLLMRIQLSSVLHVVIVEEGLDHVERLCEGCSVRVVGRGVLDQVLQAEAVLLHPGHRFVKQVLQGEALSLLLPFQRSQLDAARQVGKLGVVLGAAVEGGQGSGVVAEELGVHLGLLGEHLEVVSQLLIPGRIPTVNLSLQRLVEVVVELV